MSLMKEVNIIRGWNSNVTLSFPLCCTCGRGGVLSATLEGLLMTLHRQIQLFSVHAPFAATNAFGNTISSCLKTLLCWKRGSFTLRTTLYNVYEGNLYAFSCRFQILATSACCISVWLVILYTFHSPYFNFKCWENSKCDAFNFYYAHTFYCNYYSFLQAISAS